MKFFDLESPIPEANYSIDVSWKYLPEWIRDQQDRRLACLDLNPDFQRGRVWTDEQKSKYLEYILRGGVSGKDLYLNCVGWNHDYRGPYVIVDGLQRLTAVLDFLDDKVPVCGTLYSEFEDRLRVHVGFKIHINNLKTRKEVLLWYLALNSEGTPHTELELNRVRKLLDNA